MPYSDAGRLHWADTLMFATVAGLTAFHTTPAVTEAVPNAEI